VRETCASDVRKPSEIKPYGQLRPRQRPWGSIASPWLPRSHALAFRLCARVVPPHMEATSRAHSVVIFLPLPWCFVGVPAAVSLCPRLCDFAEFHTWPVIEQGPATRGLHRDPTSAVRHWRGGRSFLVVLSPMVVTRSYYFFQEKRQLAKAGGARWCVFLMDASVGSWAARQCQFLACGP
jgi:hypothetical protein